MRQENVEKRTFLNMLLKHLIFVCSCFKIGIHKENRINWIRSARSADRSPTVMEVYLWHIHILILN